GADEREGHDQAEKGFRDPLHRIQDVTERRIRNLRHLSQNPPARSGAKPRSGLEELKGLGKASPLQNHHRSLHYGMPSKLRETSSRRTAKAVDPGAGQLDRSQIWYRV